jgi:hypothetical protein
MRRKLKGPRSDIEKRRNERKRRTVHKKRRPTSRSRRSQRKHVVPRTAKEYSAMPERSQDRWDRVAHVISKMRSEDISLSKASREFGVSPRTVTRLGASALRKRSNGRYATKSHDRLLRILRIPTTQGSGEIAVRDSRQATQLAEYWIAVHRYLQTGDASSIKNFRGKSITDANGKRVRLVTDLDELNRLGSAGAFSFESLYARAN